METKIVYLLKFLAAKMSACFEVVRQSIAGLLFDEAEENLDWKSLKVAKIAKLSRGVQFKVANRYLTDSATNVRLTVTAASALSNEVVSLSRELKGKLESAPKLSDEGLMHHLLCEDKKLHIEKIKAQKAILEAKDCVVAVGSFIDELNVSIVHHSIEIKQNAANILIDAVRMIIEAEDLLIHSINHASPPKHLLAEVIQLTSNIEKDMGISLTGIFSVEAMKLYHTNLAAHLEQSHKNNLLQKFGVTDSANYLLKWKQEEGKRRQLDTLLDQRMLKINKSTLSIGHLKRVKKNLEVLYSRRNSGVLKITQGELARQGQLQQQFIL